MSKQTQTVVEVTGFAARCTCGWEGNWTPLKDDSELQAAEHDLLHDEEEAQQVTDG